jgi:hypothetical protein
VRCVQRQSNTKRTARLRGTHPGLLEQRGVEKKDCAPLYKDTKPLIKFMRSVMGRVVLRLRGKQQTTLLGGNAYHYRVVPVSRDLAVAMCLRSTTRLAFETLHTEVNNTSPCGRSRESYQLVAEMVSQSMRGPQRRPHAAWLEEASEVEWVWALA